MSLSLDNLLNDLRPGNRLYLPAGHYELLAPSIPLFREKTGEATKVVSSGIVGAGMGQTIIHVIGNHDGLNCNNVADLQFREFTLKCAEASGINYVSLTNGTRDVLVDSVEFVGLPATPWNDDWKPNKDLPPNRYQGGKAVTIQAGRSHSRNVQVRNCVFRDCPIAMGIDCIAGQDASLIAIHNRVVGCDVALALSCTAETTNPRMNAYVDGLSVEDTCRLLLNVRYSNTRLNRVTVSELRTVVPNRFWAGSPFRSYFQENRLDCRPGRDVVIENSNIYSDSKWDYSSGQADVSGLWMYVGPPWAGIR